MTILYADLVGFCELSYKISDPLRSAVQLQRLFKRLDGLTIKHNVFKVHTIGDCYVMIGCN